MNGIIIVDKPINYTSRDVVNILSKKFNTKKIGHAGTLDPLATGVLVIAFGKYTKLLEILTGYEKEYEFECVFGKSTDTYDIEGNIISDNPSLISSEKLKQAITYFPKKYLQEVPKYSAVKINGKKLYEYARANVNIELPKREVSILDFSYIDSYDKCDHTYLKAKVKVSKGTYIRSLIVDLAKSLDSTACMSYLRRTKQGMFDINDAYELDDILNDNYNFVNLDEALSYFEKRDLNDDEYQIVKNGGLMKDSVDTVLYTYKGKNIAIYKRYLKNPDYLKPWKMF